MSNSVKKIGQKTIRNSKNFSKTIAEKLPKVASTKKLLPQNKTIQGLNKISGKIKLKAARLFQSVLPKARLFVNEEKSRLTEQVIKNLIESEIVNYSLDFVIWRISSIFIREGWISLKFGYLQERYDHFGKCFRTTVKYRKLEKSRFVNSNLVTSQPWPILQWKRTKNTSSDLKRVDNEKFSTPHAVEPNTDDKPRQYSFSLALIQVFKPNEYIDSIVETKTVPVLVRNRKNELKVALTKAVVKKSEFSEGQILKRQNFEPIQAERDDTMFNHRHCFQIPLRNCYSESYFHKNNPREIRKLAIDNFRKQKRCRYRSTKNTLKTLPASKQERDCRFFPKPNKSTSQKSAFQKSPFDSYGNIPARKVVLNTDFENYLARRSMTFVAAKRSSVMLALEVSDSEIISCKKSGSREKQLNKEPNSWGDDLPSDSDVVESESCGLLGSILDSSFGDASEEVETVEHIDNDELGTHEIYESDGNSNRGVIH